MIRRTQWKAATVLAAAAAVAGPAAGRAQNATTGTLGGVVRDARQGVLPGAAVVAAHVPTGTRHEAFTRADGRFDLLNVQVGPYDLEVAMSGFAPWSLSDVAVTLGEATEVPVTSRSAPAEARRAAGRGSSFDNAGRPSEATAAPCPWYRAGSHAGAFVAVKRLWSL